MTAEDRVFPYKFPPFSSGCFTIALIRSPDHCLQQAVLAAAIFPQMPICTAGSATYATGGIADAFDSDRWHLADCAGGLRLHEPCHLRFSHHRWRYITALIAFALAGTCWFLLNCQTQNIYGDAGSLCLDLNHVLCIRLIQVKCTRPTPCTGICIGYSIDTCL